VICCSQYNKLINEQGKQRFDDMLEADEEADFMVEKFKELNYQVQLCRNPTRKEMNVLFKELSKMITETAKQKERVLIHFYYTGHGKMKEQTFAVLNEPVSKDALFPLESKIRNLSMHKNTSVYALFDCCRQ